MAFLPWVLTVSAAATVPALLLGGKVRRWVGARRNRAGACAGCSRPPGSETFLVHGLVFCAKCTVGARARFTATLWLAAGAAILAPIVAIAGFLGSAVGGDFGWWHWFHAVPLLGPPVLIGAAAGIQLRRMRRANQRILGSSSAKLLSGPQN